MPKAHEHAVDIEQLTVRRGGRSVLHEVDLTIPRGSITGLLGPSGCGKTTLIRAIVGTQIVESGKVTVLGARLVPLPAKPGRIRHPVPERLPGSDRSLETSSTSVRCTAVRGPAVAVDAID